MHQFYMRWGLERVAQPSRTLSLSSKRFGPGLLRLDLPACQREPRLSLSVLGCPMRADPIALASGRVLARQLSRWRWPRGSAPSRHPLTGFSCKLENAARFRFCFWTSPSMTNSALGLMRASSSLRMEIEASSSFKKEGHGRRVGAWARGGVAHGRRWHGSLRPSGGITYRTIRAASHNLNESVACK